MKSMKRKNELVKRVMALMLALVMLLGIVPINMTVADAATTASVSLTSLGNRGTVSLGSKTKSGTWWQMHLQGKKAFCIDLGYTCHTGNTYAAQESHKWDQSTGGKNGCYAKVIRWFVIDKNRTDKAFVMAQALIWSIAEGHTSEAQLKDVIKQAKNNTNISPNKSVNDVYKDIFEPSGAWTAGLTFWQKTGNSKIYQRLLTVDADDIPEIDYKPASISDRTYYRQRITVKKKDEDGKGLGGIQFTLDADNLDGLYSFQVSDRDGVDASDADEDNDTSFSLTGYTRDSGRIAYRMTYKLETKKYYYYSDSELAKMTADQKKEAKKYLTEKKDLDEGEDFASDMTKASAQKLMDKEMKQLKNDISNTYTLTENSTGDNKHIILDPELAKGVKITLKKENSWEKNSEGKWLDSLEETPSDYSKAYITGVTNKYKKASIEVIKTDKYSDDKKAHGDADLDGAEFQLYAEAACTNKATVYNADGTAKTAGVYTIKDGKAETDYLRSGVTYYLKEIKAPKGYLLSNEVVPMTADASKVTVEVTPKITKAEFGNSPILGKVAVMKYYSEGKTGALHPEADTTFQVYLTRKGSFDACDKYERALIKTDEKGYGITGDLYYGDYTVHQVDSGSVDAIHVEDFPVEVKKNGEVYTYAMNNELFKAYLKILKKDKNTEKQVLKPGTTYQIYTVDGEKEELVEQSYSDGNQIKTINQFVTNESGEIMTVKELKSGNYRIYETDSASGLHITEKYIEVTINSRAGNYESWTDEDGYTHAVVTATYTNEETYAKLKLYKTGEMLTGYEGGKFVYESRFLKGTVFEITAAEDIVTQDNQGTNWYDRGELVATITTGEGAEFEKECRNITASEMDQDGTVTVCLPLGKYHVKEVKTLYGYVLPDEGWDVEFNWKNKDEEYVLNATDVTDRDGVLRVENALAKTAVSLVKSDAATRQAVEGAEFGIFTRNDIYSVDGKKIVDAGAQLGTVKTDTEGKAVSDIDFPLMSEGYPKAVSGGALEVPAVAEDKAPGVPEAGTVPLMSGMFQPYSLFRLSEDETLEMDNEDEDTDGEEDTEDGETGSMTAPGSAASVETDSAEGAAGTTAALNSGDYYIKELSVSGSYYLNDTEYPVHLEYKDQETKVIEAEVKAENTQTTAVVSKQSATGSGELEGCGLKITDAGENVIAEWVSGDKESVRLNEKLTEMGYRNAAAEMDETGNLQVRGLLHDTTYTLTETRPADGFATADSISFQLIRGENGQTLAAVVEDGEMTLQTDNVVRMVDDTTKVEISKTDIAESEEIPGCELEITEKETGDVVDKWTSTEEKHLIEQKFVAGKSYVLTEKRPADGYATADSIEFTVEDTGEIQSVHMVDETTKIRLVKLDGKTGQGLRGAKFEVYDSKGKKVMKFTSKEDGNDINGKLVIGETYTFKEIEAPKGYKLAKPVKYKIKDTGGVQKISVTDKRVPKPKVPQTGGNTPLILALILLAALASGGLFLFRRKKGCL